MVVAYLKGIETSPGNFPNEVAIFLRDYKGESYSGFADKKYLRDGMLEVCILEQVGQLALVQSSDRGDGSEFLNGKRNLTVRKSDLVYVE